MSNRITKSQAGSIALKVADAYYGQMIEKAEKDKVEYATRFALDVIPKPVMGCLAEYKNWLATSVGAYFTTENRDAYLYSVLNVNVPLMKQSTMPVLVIDSACYKRLSSCINVLNDLNDNYDKMVSEISSTILKLGTRKRVLEELPDIAEYLPAVEEKHLPSTTFGDIRSILKSIKNGKNCNH